jgi:pyruvate dehydrogenase E1 component beta subunit
LVVAHESVAVTGFGAEVVATVAQHSTLKTPPKRLGSPRGLIAYAPNLEDQMRVTAEMIANAAKKTMEMETT